MTFVIIVCTPRIYFFRLGVCFYYPSLFFFSPSIILAETSFGARLFNCCAFSGGSASLRSLILRVESLWLNALQCRSQRNRLNGDDVDGAQDHLFHAAGY